MPILVEEPLKKILHELLTDKKIVAAIMEEYGDKAPGILEKLQNGGQDLDDGHTLFQLIKDVIHNEAECVDWLSGFGGYGEFSINIEKFGPFYWVSAPDFDNSGYFRDQASARKYAELEYEGFITAYNEQKDE